MFSDPTGTVGALGHQRMLLDASSKHNESRISGISYSIDNHNINLHSQNATIQNQQQNITAGDKPAPNIDVPGSIADLIDQTIINDRSNGLLSDVPHLLSNKSNINDETYINDIDHNTNDNSTVDQS